MELEQNTPLTLPLFLLDEHIEQRDLETSDLTLSVILDETLLANLCQNPAEDQSISINLETYQLFADNSQFKPVISEAHQAQLLLNRGPVLSAVVSSGEQVFISPPVEMMPTFDLGDEEEEA
ncbi:hypothetical protein CWB73_19910 [Pseudoalteromonas phenolica]|uniref:Orphan protein n=1 Tax=Pseudoalteromonas phenolica TaxID=161398 RepID=A0A5S3YPG1_9GAMM|nr:hypothetical protein [Pseudoalteromonas phenolica]TMP77453.1 hypothetical protein CWB73_19910 [Pseudoalteromonas phenolica]